MTPPAEGQEKDVLLVLDKQQGKVSAVKGIDKEGNLQTVPPTQGGEFMQVDKNSDVFSNFISNFFRKYQDTSGLELFSVKASEAERDAKAIEDNHRNPTPEGDKRAEMLRVPKPDFHEFKQGYRFDPSKIDWENLKKVGITADTLKNTKDFDRVMRGYKSRNTYTVSGTVGGFYLKPTDVKLSFYQAKDGTVVPKLHGVQQDEKLLQRPFHEHEFTKQEQGNLQGTGNLGGIAEIKDPKSGEQIPVFVSRDRYTHELEYMRADKWKCPDTICNVQVSPEQKAAFEAGQAVKMENLQFRDGTKRSAYLQVSAVERGLEFLPRAAVQFLQQWQQPAEQQVAGLEVRVHRVVRLDRQSEHDAEQHQQQCGQRPGAQKKLLHVRQRTAALCLVHGAASLRRRQTTASAAPAASSQTAGAASCARPVGGTPSLLLTQVTAASPVRVAV